MNIFDHINKQAALTVLAVTLFIAGFFFYYLGDTSTSPAGVNEVDDTGINATLGKELLSALARLRATSFDMSIFTDPVFTGLKDFGVEIAPQPVGRRNPFALFEGNAPPKKSTGVKTPSTPSVVPKTTTGGFDLE